MCFADRPTHARRAAVDENGSVYARAFTLLEGMIALACATFIATAAIGTYSGIIGKVAALRAKLVLPDEGRMAVAHIVDAVRGAGGGSLPPGAAIDWQPSRDGTSAPTSLSVLVPRPLPVFVVGEQSGFLLKSSPCTDEVPSASPAEPAYAVLMRTDGGALVAFHEIVVDESGEQCRFVIGETLDFAPLMADPNDMLGASIIPVRYRTISKEGPTLRSTWNGSPPPSVSDENVLTERVRAMELSFGYDFAPREGRVVHYPADPEADGWLYNTPAEFPLSSMPFSTPEDLRAVSVALVLEASSRDAQTASARLPSGTSVSGVGVILHLAHGSAALRSGG